MGAVFVVPSLRDLRSVGMAAGLDALGVADAAPFSESRSLIEQRRAAGLAAGMQFTYRNPARSTEPGQALPGARALVVGARSYRQHDPEPVDSSGVGSVARYAWSDAYADLRAGLGAVAAVLADAGWRARVLVDDNALVDREAAFRAGLGWYGKNTMFLLEGRGSEFVLGSVVTDAPLPAGPPPAERSQCGSCSRCMPACPTGALVEPGVLDARRCLAWLLQAEGVFARHHRADLGGRFYGCDECQEVCPPNRIEIRRRPPPPTGRDAAVTAEVDLVAVLAERDDGVLLARYGRWYVARRQARYLRRNALVALGNVGDGRDAATAAAVALHLGPEVDDLVRAHAVWAASRLGLDGELEAVRSTTNGPLVCDELGALPGPRLGMAEP